VRVPVSWLAEHLELTEDVTTAAFPDAFVRVGHEVEDVTEVGPLTGPLVIGRVAEIEELTEFKKPIRYCRVEIGRAVPDESDEDDGDEADSDELSILEEPETRGVICGATNFDEGDLVVVALPGAVLAGDFEIAARKSYGRLSEGMICSARELGIGADHAGILVLPSGFADPGADAAKLLELDETLIDLEITPDRGYALSVRGLSRELACALDLPFGDPAAIDVPVAEGEAWPVHLDPSSGCMRFVTRRVTGIDPTAPTPWEIRRRLMLAGIRSISLAVDVTNYVMLEMGQPLHAFDAATLRGDLYVRQAEAGEKLSTLDAVERELHEEDVVICDDSGPVSLAGVMGGASTEIGEDSTDILLEAAIWDPKLIARTVRRHKLPSEASKRFERFVDPELPPAALERAARLLRQYGDGSIEPGRTDAGEPPEPKPVTMPIDLPDRVAGIWYKRGVTVTRLTKIGCQLDVNTTDGTPSVTATPPSWRNDLNQPADLVEEVLRLEGYDTIPSIVPAAPAGGGLTRTQRRRRAAARALAEAGYYEVQPFPFTRESVWDDLGLAADDPRRCTLRVLNPLEAGVDRLASTLLPGMLETLSRNISRGNRDLSLYFIGQVTQPTPDLPEVPELGVAERPTDAQLARMHAALPKQPTHASVVLTGNREQQGWWGEGSQAIWADAIQAAHVVAGAYGVELNVRAGNYAPWHPGRCAELLLDDTVVGHAGELHPKTIEALGLPKRTCAMEVDLDALPANEIRRAPLVSPYPPVLLDVALVLDAEVPSAEVAQTLREGAGELLESLSLFDVYTGTQLGEGKRSLAYSLRFRAPERTLTVEEANTAKEAAVAAVTERYGATLRA
jgi:phenylalanyl-tRNA synthetase beta chain